MKKLDTTLKSFSLVYTDTLMRTDFFKKDFNIDAVEVNHDNAICLYDIVKLFNDIHREFKKEYEKLPKLDLGKSVKVWSYSEGLLNGRKLILDVGNPTFSNKDVDFIFIEEKNGNITTYIANSFSPFYKNHKRRDIDLDKEIAQAYLDLFAKYNPLFKFYQTYRSQDVYNDGAYVLLSKIISSNNDILGDMTSMEFTLRTYYRYCPGDYINISLNIGDEIKINQEKSNISLYGVELKNKDIDLEKVIKDIYINKYYFNYAYNSPKFNTLDSLIELYESLNSKKRVLKKD